MPDQTPPERLCGPARELVRAGGSLGGQPFTVPPLSRAALRRERGCLLRELRAPTARLAEIDALLLAPPPAASSSHA